MTRLSGAAAAPASAANPPPLRLIVMKYCVMALLATGVLVIGSGRSNWLRAWLYIGFTVSLQVTVGVALYRNAPDLLIERSRLQAGTESWDKVLAPAVALLCPLAMWSVAALDVRVNWPPPVPIAWSVAGFAVCMTGALLTVWAMLANRFFSGTVRIQADRGHVLIDTGPYRYVRHPGYSGALVFTMASPVALGSWLALVPAAITAILLVVRTALEDRTLRAALQGYEAYTRRTRWRLLPGVW